MIVSRFEEQVKMHPECIAIKTVDREVSYQMLNSYANGIADEVMNKYTEHLENKKNRTVALLFEHGIAMIIGTIAALKANKTYVPFDPSYPMKRLAYMLENSEADLIITNNRNMELALRLVNETKASIRIFNIDEKEYSTSIENMDRKICDNEIAYILYTSGSTGKPKGVIQTHKNILHFIKSYTNTLGITRQDKMTLFSAFSHDAAIMDIYGALLNGATLYPLNIKDKIGINELSSWLQNEEITIYHSVPTVYRHFINILTEKEKRKFEKLRFIVLGGEEVIEHDVSMFKKIFTGTSTKLVNLYGQTESSYNSSQIFSADCEIENITLGEAVEDTEILVVDENRVEVSRLRVGEIVVLSDYIALGYWKDEEKTKEVFEYSEESGKLYWTGDLGRLLEDGSIKFVGRKGSQVKIRGYRIELGEVETQLLNHEEIKEAVVLGRKNANDEDYLAAYIVSDKSLTVEELREHLSIQLPEYMIPSKFVQLEKIPLTPNNKVDKKALIEEEGILLSSIEYEAPRNEAEEKLVKIWTEILGIDKIGINDNFFNLGGHSLKATSLVSKIHKEFDVQISLEKVFKIPTIKELSRYIEKAEENMYSNIEKAEEKEYYEASSAQKRMYILQQFDKESTAYNMPMVLELGGKIDKNKIEEAFKELSKRHEALRTYFETIDGDIVQKIDNDYEFKLEQREGNIENAVRSFIKPFELEKAPLFRAELVEDKEKIYLLVDMHHIISDGVSMSIITNEFAQLYNGKKLDELKLQYKDFAEWQNNFLKTEEMKKQEEYWINRFSDEIPVLNMPTDYERPAVQSYEGDSVSFEISEEITSKLRKLIRETGTTMHMALLSAFNILLSKYSGQEDIVIGTPIAGRPHADLENIMGIFVNTIALRNRPEGEKRYIDFLKEVKENSLKAYENQSYQFEELVEKLDIRRDTSRNPIFDVMFVLQNMDRKDEHTEELVIKTYTLENKTSKFDLLLVGAESKNTISLRLQYCTKLFNNETIYKMINHFEKIINDITDDIKVNISQIELTSEEEKNKIIYEFNNTSAAYIEENTLQKLFENQVVKTPENIAVSFKDNKLTYKELNQKANQVARKLIQKGVNKGDIIAVFAERSIESIIGILSILKSGAVYLPINVEYPDERIKYILKDSKTKYILRTKDFGQRIIESKDIEILNLDDETEFNSLPKDNLEIMMNSDDELYVIYTSGTTGNPKGVVVGERVINNLIQSQYRNSDIDFTEKVMQFNNIGFDVSIQEIYSALLSGGELCIVEESVKKDITEVFKFIEKNEIEVIYMPTAVTKFIFSNSYYYENFPKCVKHLITAGEQLVVSDMLKNYIRENDLKIHNHYGPSETHVATTYTIESGDKLKDISPIGKPINNTKIYILGAGNEIKPIGVFGEMYISGYCLGKGYLGNAELTETKFIDNPFETGTKIYKTGDLARWLPDGNIEFLGRIDNQVKIRGFRIELGEIESRILKHEKVKEAAVLLKENKEKEKYICAYITSEDSLEELDLRNYLREILPEYMIPSYFVQIEKMPLTSNGKLDRRQLPEPDMELISSEYEAPRNEVEEILAKIWSEVLGVERVGINDNFFDLGGHSLKATVLVSKIHKELNREIPLKELFKTPTIKELSKYIESVEENMYSNIEKIEEIKEIEYYEASSAQKRMYILQQFDKESTAYNMPMVLELEGKIDKNKIEETFKELSKRHEALKTYFETIDGEIVQKIQSDGKFKLEQRKGNIENAVRRFIKPFELEKAPLFRAELVEDKEKVYLLVDMHHIVSDGVSMSIIINEFTQLYNGKILKPLKLQYKDFAEWQNKFLKTEEMKKQEEYWINRFSDEIPVLNMPTDYERPVVQSFDGDSVRFEISEEITSKLRKLTRETGTTMHMAILSVFNVLLSKYSGQEDIVIGTPIAGRSHTDLENIVGMFVNTIALRNKPEGEKRYIDFLKEVKENSLKAYENQSYQFEELVEKLDIRRDTSRNPIFDVMFNIVDTINNRDIKLEDIILKPYNNGRKISKFDMTLNAIESGAKVYFSIEYCTKLFKKDTIKRLSNHCVRIIDIIVNDKEIKLSEIDLLSEAEKDQILYEFNNTKAEYPKEKTIQELFEEQVERTPDNIAVVFEEEKLTYKELNEKSNSLARELREKGVKEDSIVGIMVERSLEMIVGIMGILKAGGAYLPIDPSYPTERIEYMLEDSKAKILLSEKSLLESIEFEGIVIDLCKEELYKNDKSNLVKMNTSNNLAYVIYTSGSTGKPKGVMIEHRQVNNFIHGIVKEVKLDLYKNILCITTVCFDIFGLETLVPLTNGLNVIIASREDSISAERLGKLIDKNKIEVMQITPSRLNILLENEIFQESISNIKAVLIGGEEVSSRVLKIWDKNTTTEIYNVYGPTETTIWSTIKQLRKYEKILIGRPINNTRIYILNNNKLMPVGVAGELCIAGDGLARGYLNRPELTKEKFVDNPFEPGTKMYRTGDLARWMPDGNIEFFGRMDNQVKIRGFRIELGEIESRILQHEEIKEAAVLLKENKEKDKYICAYVVSENSLEELNLKNYLKEILPEYMIPSYFVQIEKMPLTPNGKLDRKQLPEPDMELISSEYEEPRNEIEETLAKIWSEVLGVERVGINDNFFDLGGHSLKATMLVSKIHKELNREIPLKELFRTPMIKELSKYIENAEENMYSNIEDIKEIEEIEYYEASSAQKRMYILQQFDRESTAYNMPMILELGGKIDKNKIEEAFKELSKRHEALRTYFETMDGEIVQKIQNEYEFKLEQRKENIENAVRSFIKPFELEKAPLFRAELAEDKEKVYLLVDMHHIISDGVSMSIITNEFAQLYNGKKLDELKLQYKDFAVWQNKFLKTEEMKKQEEYWINRFSDEIPVLNMPTDYERPAVQSYEGDSVSFEISEEITSKLRKLTRETGTTMHMVLLSAFNILLSKYSGQEDIVIGTPIAGRPHADLENIVGMFVNTIALRNKPEGEKRYIDFLEEVKENSLKTYENQSYQFEELVEKLDIRRDTSRNPIFDVMFNIADTINNRDIKLEDIILKPYNNGRKISKFDMTLNAIESGVKVYFSIEYCTKLFKKDTIKRLSNHYIKLLDNIVSNVKIKLSEIELLSEKEKKQILEEFNDTKAEYPKEKTIQGLFEEQVERTPDNIAVVFEEEKLTYKELNERANSLARALRDKGVKADSIVGIMAERSLEMIVGIMGILKAGGAYLPIDPSYPKERIEYMLEDSKANILLSEESLLESIEFEGIVIDLYKEELYKNDISNLEKINTSNNLAYVIYTSGSTGKPKGVMIEHRQVNNFIQGIVKEVKLDLYKNILCITTICFDIFGLETLVPLTNGLNVIIASREDSISAERLGKLIDKNKIEVMQITPSRLNILLENEIFQESISNIKAVLIGGEEVSSRVFKIWDKNTATEIYNVYGPTETTIWSTIKQLRKYEKILIGRPINNTRVYIVNNNKLMPVGVAGELCIAGDGVARGYFNRLELTKEKFVDNPFESGTKMYKTGDLARWMPDGNIEFFGRMDNQVKIRGFRIELGEIESRILQHEEIKEAAVVLKENKENEKYICAYVVSENSLEELKLKNYLKEILPEYMIPSYFIQIEKMPLTPNGKLDRRQLPEPDMELISSEYEAPRNEVEEILSRIWSEILGVERVGINDNFFDLGGHSLKATMLVSKIHKELNREIQLQELFRTPTIKELSKYIEKAEENMYSNIEKAEEKEYYEASSAQKRMYILQQFDKDSTAYNMPSVFELEGKIDKNKIEESFRNLSKRHDALRTYFETVDGEIVQKIQSDYEFKLEQIKGNIEEIINSFVIPFELERTPLFRAELVEDKEKVYLLVDMHHIISDGVSMSIITNEFAQLYNGKKPDELKLQYKDFAEWQNKFLKTEEMKKQEEYWINRFSDDIPVLNMPTDYERPAVQSFEGDSVNFEISEEITSKLRKLTKETGTTMHMALLSAFNILLSKYSEQEDIVIGTPIAGRPHADLENIVGMFVNTIALRNKPEGEKRYIDFLKEVKENSLKAYENQSYQLETLVEKLDIRRDTSRNPLFDVMFNIADTINNRGDIKLEDIMLKSYNTGSKISKFDMTLNAIEGGVKVYFSIEYCTKLFKKETIERLSNHYIKLLDSIVDNVEIKLGEVDLLSEAEKNQILYEFNDTKADYPKDKTINELFEAQAEKTPDNIAVVFEEEKLTYKELNEKSNSLAKELREKGVKADSIVGIMTEKSLEMIIGIMGILKAGGAYLPIDPSYPKERIEYMLEDSKAKILLSEESLLENIEFEGIIIDLYKEELYKNDTSNLVKINTSNNLAYVIYTSGSTGIPKGVLVEHKSVIRLVKNTNYIEFETDDKILQTGSMVFDASTFEVWGSLLNGLELHLAKNETIMIAQSLEELLIKNNISILWLTSELFNQMAEININIFRGLRCLLVGGDILSPKYINSVREKFADLKIINGYGPTENTTFSTTYLIKDISFNIPIGRPISNTKAYIVNKGNRLNPIGIYGELCLSGAGLARGYLNREELTKEKFVDNPFETGTKMYKTGDLARWLPDGNIEFLGRVDNQVKIRGFRIELGEIENRILQHEKIKEAAVLVKENKENEKYICAYIVSEDSLEELNLKNYLKEILPEYMIPSYFVQIEKMPLTSNGKLDRRQLPDPDMELISSEYEAPRNEVEETLARIWSEVLGVERVGINDNFFELGGHSLKATIIASKIYNELGVTVPLVELYNNPYVSYVSEYIFSVDLEEFQKNEYIVLLKKGINKDKNFFFIHSLSGEAEVYTNLVRNTYTSFNYWGIRYKKTDSIDSCVSTIEELARDYIIEIKKIQPTGPYYISGWCIGGVIALEIAKQLEKMNDEVKFVGLYNSPTINENLFHHRSLKRKLGISLKSEFNILEKILPGYNLREKYKGIKSVENLWSCVVEYLDKEKNYDEIKEKIYTQICLMAPIMKKVIKEYKKLSIRDILHYFNLYRGILYVFYGLYKSKERINAEITYFVAGKEPKENKESWNNYTNKTTNFYIVDADHFSMFEAEEDIKKLSKVLENVLKNIS